MPNTRFKHAAALALLCCSMCAAPASALIDDVLADAEIQGSIDRARLSEVVNLYFAMLQAYDPEEATRLGIHSADYQLTPRDVKTDTMIKDSVANMQRQVQTLRNDAMLYEDRVDLELFNNALALQVFTRQQLPPMKRDPQYYLRATESLFDVLSNDYIGYSTRIQNALSRLEQYPDVLLEAERNLYHPPELFTRMALTQLQFASESLKKVPPYFKRYTLFDPLARIQVDQAMTAAKKGLERYKTMLKEEVLPISDGDARIGRDNYAKLLQYQHGYSGTLEELEKTLAEAVRKYRAEYEAALAQEFNDRKITIMDFDWPQRQVERDAPDSRTEEELVSEFQKEMERAYRFFDKKRLLVVPQQKLRFLITPPYLLTTTTFVDYRRPFPLDSYPVAEVLLSYPDKRLSKAQREQLFKSRFSKLNIEMLSAQEVMPGRHMRQAAMDKASQPRRVFDQPWLENGWSLYALKLCIEQEYFSSPKLANMMFLRWKYFKAVRALADLRMHCKDMTFDQAADFIAENTGVSRPASQAEANYIAMHPGDAPGYVLGYESILRMRQRYTASMKESFDLREFHMRLLWLGNVPFDKLEESLYQAYAKQYPRMRL
ncbi:MAG: DUF885 domain-containing protein [Elusimicrobia bacterium]|nr:DUF885 domain-containing protein [Elusimicrobiota bacterium]